MLTALGDALPGQGAAFLVVSPDLAVSAVSRAGEKIFGDEDDLIGAHLLDVVTSPLGDGQLEDHARRAAQRRRETLVASRAAEGRLRAVRGHPVRPHRALLVPRRRAPRGRAGPLRFSLIRRAETVQERVHRLR